MNITNWNDLPTILTVKEAAQVVRICNESMYKLTRTKDFPCTRKGRIIRIPRDAFRVWLEQSVNTIDE
jgi:excisionase family DNA binding protein